MPRRKERDIAEERARLRLWNHRQMLAETLQVGCRGEFREGEETGGHTRNRDVRANDRVTERTDPHGIARAEQNAFGLVPDRKCEVADHVMHTIFLPAAPCVAEQRAIGMP